MSIRSQEQLTNRARLTAILPKCGLRKKHQRKVRKMLARYGVSNATYDRGVLRYGDSCVSAEFPPWTGGSTPRSSKCE